MKLHLHKLMFAGVLLLAAGSVALCLVMMNGKGHDGISSLSLIMRITEFAILCWLGFYCFRTIKSVDSMANLIKGSKTAGIRSQTPPVLAPLADAVLEVTLSSEAKVKELEKNNCDLSLQLQLLKRQKRNTEAIIYSISDAVLVTDAFDRILVANTAAEKLFDFRLKESAHESVEKVVREAGFVKYIVQSRRCQIPHVRHELIIKSDRQPRTYDCIISCVRDEEGLTCGVVAILHDITREKEISQAKNDFVGHVSHELKTPLASINAYAEMLVDGEAKDQDTLKQFCSVIQTQAQRLNRLIEDILNISRIESGLIKVKKEPVSLAILINDAVEMIKSYAQEKKITVGADSAVVYGQVDADRDMMMQVIVNLLSNAVKYTPQGGSVFVNTEVNESDQMVRITVSDTGVGIPPEDVGHVFDKFYRVEANKKCAKGTGLGLNLVKQIIESVHGGRVFVTSQVGRGSTFGFELPISVSHAVQTV